MAVFEAALRLLSPFMPFLTEELWHALYEGNAPAKSIALTKYPQASDFRCGCGVGRRDGDSPGIDYDGARHCEGTGSSGEGGCADLCCMRKIACWRWRMRMRDMLARMARCSRMEFAHEPLSGGNARSTASFDVAVVYERQIDVAASASG